MLGSHKISGMIPVSDLDKAKEFYIEKLGCKPGPQVPMTIFLEDGGGMVALYQSKHAGSSEATVAAWAVDDIEGTVDGLAEKGVTMEQYPEFGTNEKGISEGEGVKAAWFKDPDGNILGLFEG